MRISKPPQERRAELINAARLLFDKKGVDKTRISDIVREVGVAQGVFYYYFDSKAEMVRVVLEQVTGELNASVAGIMETPGLDWCQRMALFIDLYIDLIDKFTEDGATHLPPMAETLESSAFPNVSELLSGHLEALVEAGVRAGALRIAFPWQTAQVLVLGLRGLAERQLPTRKMIYAIVEQGLGLESGALRQPAPAGG
ncbi:TetR/AcrR family transcriptional regulator [Ruminococcaceae bacterium OttesenSCG-928-A11]|nr:TetR/AcrR family transcriptional regulator [Ruminococcaceae bacterium OttesenSCG-928-A11]